MGSDGSKRKLKEKVDGKKWGAERESLEKETCKTSVEGTQGENARGLQRNTWR